MMGGHHAVCGAAAWLLLTGPAVKFPLTEVAVPLAGAVHTSPMFAALGALLCAGAALGPDADHPQATIAHSAGFASKAATSLVGAVAGGHRHGTHAPLVAAAVILAAWFCSRDGLVDPVRFDRVWWVCVVVIVALAGFAVKTLRLAKRWSVAWGVGAAVAAVTTLVWPDFLPLLPTVVAVGWCAHLVGDLLTTGGLPLAWPFRASKPPMLPAWLWSEGGYVALPVLGNAGSWREWLLCVPISAYALIGFVTAVNNTLP